MKKQTHFLEAFSILAKLHQGHDDNMHYGATRGSQLFICNDKLKVFKSIITVVI